MGRLVDGKWHDVWYVTASTGGRFERQVSGFRNWVTPDGTPGPSGEGGFKAEPARYHLYVSLACPWAHRTLIIFVTGDPINGAETLSQIYVAADPHYTGCVTVPVLWDKSRRTIVSNGSAEIIRMFNKAFDGVGAAPGDYYPEPLREQIDALNTRIYPQVNNGVYRAGFATTQVAYEAAVVKLFECLDWLEKQLSKSCFLTGDQLTEADIRLL